MNERVYTGPRLTLRERAQLLEWIAEEPPLGYTEIKRRLVAHGMTIVTRQAVNHYARIQWRKQTAEKIAGNGNDREKRKTGRTPITDAEHKQLVEDVRRTVFVLRDQGIPRAEITANRVALELHIGGAERGGDTMMRRLKKGGVKQKWPAYRDSIFDGEEAVKKAAEAAG